VTRPVAPDCRVVTGLRIPGIDGLRYLAGGGFADVYRGVQTAFGREVAVKVIRGGAADDAVRRRFERECRILGSLSNHPNIVTVHDLGWLPTGEPYLVMPFLPGGTVQDRLAREGRIPIAEAAMICAKVARALQVAHDRGVVHCDVKPANVLVTEFGEPQIGDFGISRLASESSATAVAFTMRRPKCCAVPSRSLVVTCTRSARCSAR
jgi:serine/threonine-protein kinase PknK